ncbi:MAG: leucyl aminopeptidase [Miltoncostaeaceae bacterium]
MKSTLRRSADPLAAKADALVVCVADPKALDKRARAVDRGLRGALGLALGAGELDGSAGSAVEFRGGTRFGAPLIIAVGVGDAGNPMDWRDAGEAAAALLGRSRRAILAPPENATAAQVLALAEGLGTAAYRFDRFRTGDAAKRPTLERVAVHSGAVSGRDLAAVDATVAAVHGARDLSNTPANHLTPSMLADHARALGKEIDGLKVTVLERRQLDRLGAGALLSVTSGSDQPPAMIVMRYSPRTAPGDEVLGLIGKAVTFDSGGISIKPSGGMEEMKMDMGGGAAVIEGTALVARMGLPVNVLSVVPATENLINGSATKPGDVVTAMNGKTVEVINTDAEGRLIMADALTYAAREGATRLVDFATLTGAIVVALGSVYAGLFGSDAEWTERVRDAGEAGGDLVWPMPMHDRYDPLIRSSVADLANAAKKREAGAVYAAQFLREFTEGLPWCHVDIAGTGMVDGAGTGAGVRLIKALAEGLAAG